MRELKEIKEEIFKRGKARIKRRKRIVSFVLSLCVCLAVGITAFALRNPPAYEDDVYIETEYGFLADMESVSVKIVKIKYGEKEYTEEKKITEITDLIGSIVSGGIDESESFTNENSDDSVKNQSTTDVSADMSLSLYLVTESGDKEEFIMNSNSLINKSTGVAYSMNEEQRQALLDALR